MKYSRIEGIEKDWSRITLGCWQIAPSGGWGDICPEKDAEKVVRVALDQGITAFDTAEGYGDGESERRLGKALGLQKIRDAGASVTSNEIVLFELLRDAKGDRFKQMLKIVK